MSKAARIAPAVLALAAGTTAALAAPRVIYSEIPGSPTSACPDNGIAFTGFLSLYGSPDGNWWIFKAFIDDPENDVVVVGSGADGANGSLAAWEAELTGLGDGSTHEFLDSDCGINDAGVYAYGSRFDSVPDAVDEAIVKGDGSGVETAPFLEGQPAPDLFDPGSPGDEIFGNSLNSPSVLADGTVTCKADLIGNIPTANRSALYIGTSVVAQEGTTALTGETYDSFAALSGNTFSVSPDGANWIVEADIDPTFTSVEAVVVNGSVIFHDGDTFPGPTLPVDNINAVEMTSNGDWFARGDFTDDADWVVRNGTVIAITGAPIFTGSTESWSAVITGVTGDGAGNYVITGESDSGDDNQHVLVRNGTDLLARGGDGVDVDGNGMADDDAEIATFSPEDLVLAANGDVLAFVTLRSTSTGAALGDAFIVIEAAGGPCNAADCDGSGTLNTDDVECFVAAFAAMEAVADCDGNGSWNTDDIECFAAAFSAGCP